MSDSKDIFAFGPSENLIIATIKIDSWKKYITLLLSICATKMIEVVVNDIGGPNLGFSIYDPTEVVVYGFTKAELQFLANGMWAINNIGLIFKTMVIVSRLDIALISVFFGEIASTAVITYLLSKKKRFVPEYDNKQEEEEEENKRYEMDEMEFDI